MTRPAVQFPEKIDTNGNVDLTQGQRAYAHFLVSIALFLAWLTLSAAILEAITQIGGAP